jgi:DNA modification methylase
MDGKKIITKLWDVEKLVGAEYNPREITDKQFDELQDSIKRFGFVDPIIVNTHEERNGIIIAGHQRTRVAKSLGMKEIPAVELKLTLEQEKELNVRHNKSGGKFDMDALANFFEVDELMDWGFEDWELGVDDFNIEEDEALQAEEDDFNGEPPEKPKTVLGDIYELNGHRVHCASSTEIDAVEKLMDGKKANMVFTDPPYGVSYEGGHNSKKRKGIIADELQGDDLSSLFEDSINTACIISEDNAPFYIWYAGGKSMETYEGLSKTPIKVRAVICWYKVKSGLGAFMSQYIPNYEPCIYGHKENQSIQWFGPTDEKTVWELPKDRINEHHPTQKPVDLPVRAIKNSSSKGQIIYDCFLGSGSTLIGSEQANRLCYGQELDPKYVDVIVKRWVKYMKDNGKSFTVKRNDVDITKDDWLYV